MEKLLGQISWTSFTSSLILLLLIYYTYLAYHYYAEEIQALFRPKTIPGHNPFLFESQSAPENIIPTGNLKQEAATEYPLFEQESDEVFARIEAFVLEIKPAIKAASQGLDHPDQLKAAITTVLARYPDLKDSPYKPALNEMIQTECKNIAFLTLSDQETAKLWVQAIEEA